MAGQTENYHIYYPTDYDEIADVPENDRQQALSIEAALALIDLRNIVGDLTQLETTIKTSIVEAINELKGETDDIGDITQLQTTIKTSVVEAINELKGKTDDIGDLTQLETTIKNNLVNAINELKTNTYTKQEVDGKVSSVYKYKGTVASYSNLPSTDLTVGDVYNVESTGDNYAWTGTVWDKLGGDIDLSEYYTKTQTDNLLNEKQDTLESGTNIKTINNQSILGRGNINIQGGEGGGGTSDYTDLINKPSINNVTLSGNKTTSDLGLGTYSKPSGGIPKTDLASDVQTSLGKADTAIQEHQDISGKQDITDNNLTTTNKTITSAINEVDSIAKGANQALSYGNYSTMITAFNSLANNVYNVGQNVMIITLQVPDLWISGIESTSQTYTYTTDEAFTTELNTNGYVQVGYYKLSALETQKVDLTNYVTFDDYSTASTTGVVKTSAQYGVSTSSYTKNLTGAIRTYDQYQSGNDVTIICKGTLENVITGKNLESANNKTITISSSSTDNEYPSAKSVYDYIQSLNGDEVSY